MRTYVAATLTMALLSLGQVLLKLLAVKTAARGLNLNNWQQDVGKIMWLGAGACITYAAVLGCWLYVLKSLELNRAFAFAALTFVFVPLFSYILLDERISLGTMAGSALILAGILVATGL